MLRLDLTREQTNRAWLRETPAVKGLVPFQEHILEVAYTYHDERSGWSTKVDLALGHERAGIIKDDHGKIAGHFERQVQGPGTIYHKSYSGRPDDGGFGQRFYKHQEDVYRDSGIINTIRLNVNQENGYAWARIGYDFAPDDADRMIKSFRDAWRESFGTEPPALSHAWQIAALEGPDGSRFGQAFFAGRRWIGVKHLDDGEGDQVGKLFFAGWTKGGPGSGHFEHAGIPGHQGGSAPDTVSTADFVEVGHSIQPGPIYQARHDHWAELPDVIPANAVHISQTHADLIKRSGLLNEDMVRRLFYVEGLTCHVNMLGGTGNPSEVDSVPGCTIQARYYNAAGDVVGSADRWVPYNKDEPADFTVLSFAKEIDQKGVGTSLFTRQLQGLQRLGFSDVRLYADMTIGRYAWALEGAQYKPLNSGAPDDAGNHVFNLGEWLWSHKVPIPQEWPQGNPLEMQSDIRALNEYHREWRMYFQGKSAKDLATFKHPNGFKLKGSDIDNKGVPADMELDIGKAYMLERGSFGHGSWDAIIKLN